LTTTGRPISSAAAQASSASRTGRPCGTGTPAAASRVLRDRFGHRAGGVDLGGPDAPLARAPAQLHQAARGEAAVGDVARHGGVDDAAGARAQADVLVERAQAGDGGLDVEALGRARADRREQLARQLEGQPAHDFLAVLGHHLEHAGLQRGGGAAEGHRAAGLRLQGQHHVFQHMGQRQALLRVARLQGAHGGKKFAQPPFEARQGIEVELLRFAGHDGLDAGVAAPEVGAAQGADAGDVHVGQQEGVVLEGALRVPRRRRRPHRHPGPRFRCRRP
jgi:hypothetical protein